MKVLIIDDETIVRTGLKCIIDWSAYGFDICAEADNGTDGLQKILEQKPDLVLLDIKMPGMYGVDVARQARESGYEGKIIILSGYSDFEYAHEAIKSGVDAYLLKPIDEDELIDAVTRVKSKLDSELVNSAIINRSMPHMKSKIINDIICGSESALREQGSDELSLYNVDLKFDVFQVAVVENMAEDNLNENKLRSELLHEYTGEDSNIDTVCINDRTVILLKGSEAAKQLPITAQRIANHNKGKNMRLFIGVGRCTDSISDIHLSYRDAEKIVERRFFYDENKNIVFWNEINNRALVSAPVTTFDTNGYIESLQNYIEIGDRDQIKIILDKMKDDFWHMDVESEKVITLIINICTQLKKRIQQSYPHLNAESFHSDMELMNCFYSKRNLYEIFSVVEDNFNNISEKIGNVSGKNIMKKVENYISKNYGKELKLESIAQLFGYNSAYLGKMFKKTFGDNFNTYLDKIRIDGAKQLLLNENLKVYEVSEQVGFKNIDYFYKKFKHYVGQSPKEYRKSMGIVSEAG
jgi:two-component system, response regulator YesN